MSHQPQRPHPLAPRPRPHRAREFRGYEADFRQRWRAYQLKDDAGHRMGAGFIPVKAAALLRVGWCYDRLLKGTATTYTVDDLYRDYDEYTRPPSELELMQHQSARRWNR